MEVSTLHWRSWNGVRRLRSSNSLDVVTAGRVRREGAREVRRHPEGFSDGICPPHLSDSELGVRRRIPIDVLDQAGDTIEH